MKSYTIHEKALTIHRIIKCVMNLQRGGEDMGMEVSTSLVRGWIRGDDLMDAVNKAFKRWEQAWIVQRERDISDANSLDLDTTDVDVRPPSEFYKPPAGKEIRYAEAYDVIQIYRPLVYLPNKVYYMEQGQHAPTVSGDGVDIVESAISFRDKIVILRAQQKQELHKKLRSN